MSTGAVAPDRRAAGGPVAVTDYLQLATGYLQNCGSESARLDAELLLGHVLGLDRMSLYVNFDRPLEPAEVDRFRDALRKRCQGTPVAYIVGQRDFLSASLAVNSAVLIPRPETELLVEAVLQQLPAADKSGGEHEPAEARYIIADIGTGSGAIAIGLAMTLPDARLVAVDVSADALRVAQRNAQSHAVADQIEFFAGDLLTPLLVPPGADKYKGRLDVVVSNPPYITTDEWQRLPAEVRDFEPRVALDGGVDGLSLYRRLIPAAVDALKPGGLLAVEIGADQAAAVRRLLDDGAWTDVQLLQDYAGHDRIVLARKDSAGSEGT